MYTVTSRWNFGFSWQRLPYQAIQLCCGWALLSYPTSTVLNADRIKQTEQSLWRAHIRRHFLFEKHIEILKKGYRDSRNPTLVIYLLRKPFSRIQPGFYLSMKCTLRDLSCVRHLIIYSIRYYKICMENYELTISSIL